MKLEKRGSADFLRMPWKNGGGVTRQLAVWPPHADLTQFDWRVSSAEVASSGAFSHFAGVDRSLAVLAGGSLRLTLAEQAGATQLTLAPGMQLDGFAGEQPIDCQVAPGQVITDFNVMTRRSRCRHRLIRLQCRDGVPVDGAPWLCYLTDGALHADALTLQAGELLIGAGPVHLRGQAEGWLVQIIPPDSPPGRP